MTSELRPSGSDPVETRREWDLLLAKINSYANGDQSVFVTDWDWQRLQWLSYEIRRSVVPVIDWFLPVVNDPDYVEVESRYDEDFYGPDADENASGVTENAPISSYTSKGWTVVSGRELARIAGLGHDSPERLAKRAILKGRIQDYKFIMHDGKRILIVRFQTGRDESRA